MFQDHGFVPWCFAGIVTQVTPEGVILGAHVNGRSDNILKHLGPRDAVALAPVEPALTQEAADLAMLRSAVQRIRGEGAFAPTKRATYGLDAMDAWIAKMERRPFCGPCFESAPDREWTCAIDNSRTTFAGAAAVTSYLRRRLLSFPEAARPHLEATATHYEGIVELLRPSMTGEGGPHCRDFIGDLETQKAHVATVLRPVRERLAKAADEMEKALAEGETQTLGANVRRDGDRVWIEGVPDKPISWAWDAVLRGMQVILEYRGESPTLNELMVYSGDAFNLCHGARRQGVAYLCTPADPVRNIAEAYGFAYEAVHDGFGVEKMDKLDREERLKVTAATLERIRSEIAAGRPVLAGGSYAKSRRPPVTCGP